MRFSPRPNRANLVNWHEWGPEAFHVAQEQDRLVMVFLSAFWCGVCQRMDETSLSDAEVIALLNAYFIPIRVEDSQRPDVDIRYNQNGWPTIAFMTPQGDHLTSVNFMAPDQFKDILIRVYQLYQEQGLAIRKAGTKSREQALQKGIEVSSKREMTLDIPSEVSGMLLGLHDAVYGGYGSDHKYPHTEANEFLLYRYQVTGDIFYLSRVTLTLDRMKSGKIYDQQNGGFFRYSSKPDWSEPHPEKLLVDQARLLRNYLHAYLLTENQDYRRIAEELISYLDTTLAAPLAYAFRGCQDYVRLQEGVRLEATGITANMASLIDDWIYTDANAQTVSAYLDGWWILGNPNCLTRAFDTLEFLWEKCRDPNGGMYHYFDGEAHVPGLLMDDVYMGIALLDAYSASGKVQYLDRARILANTIVDDYGNPAGGFYDIKGEEVANLRFRLTVIAQNGVSAAFFIRLAALTGENQYRQWAYWALETFGTDFRKYGMFAVEYGHAVDRYLSTTLQIAMHNCVGNKDGRTLARAALTQLGHTSINLKFVETTTPDDIRDAATEIYLKSALVRLGPIRDAKDLTPELITTTLSAEAVGQEHPSIHLPAD
ncbi:DUF255 domain-containing protein [Dehalococcoidia bacterium]|nr:DUF255 domain-containing protein [Dehalococcoidia bacterium]